MSIEPKLCKSSSGWYVHFRLDGKQYRFKKDINRIKDLKERERVANILVSSIKQKYASGWHPEKKVKEPEKITFIDALNFALSKKKVNKKTISGYKGTVKFVTEAVNSLSLQFIAMEDVKRHHIKKILEKASKNRNWSNKAYNKHLGHLGAIISELFDWDIIEVNPAHNIRKLPVTESTANKPATKEEQLKIKRHLILTQPYFYNFVITIFHTGIRPKEILLIKLYMVDLKNQVINLPADITKNKKDRVVPINNHLLEAFIDLEVEKYPKDFYLFGSYREPGKGNKGKHLDFIPAPTKIKRDTATKRWKRVVKDGLGIDVNLYSNKHAGADAKIIAGIDLDALRDLYGHGSKQMTRVYVKQITEYYKNQIIDKSPEF